MPSAAVTQSKFFAPGHRNVNTTSQNNPALQPCDARPVDRNTTLTQQAEAILARAKAIDAYTDRDLADERLHGERSEEAAALFRLCEDLMADADDLQGERFGTDSDFKYEQSVSDRLHAEARS